MRNKTSLTAVLVAFSFTACGGGGGGSDTAVSPSPTAPGAPPPAAASPTPTAPPAGTPITAPSPSPGKTPAEPVLPPATGEQFSGDLIRRALAQAIPALNQTEAGRYLYLEQGNPLQDSIAGRIASDGSTVTSSTVVARGASYETSRVATVATATVNGGIVPIVDGVQLEGAPLSLAGNLTANTRYPATAWSSTSNGAVRTAQLLPATVDGSPGALRLCWLIQSPSAFRLACTLHRAGDASIFGATIDEDVDGTSYKFRWQWEATAPATGQWTLADYAPGGKAEIAARQMTCTTTTQGPGAPAPTTDLRQVSLTPSQLKIGDQTFERHEITSNTTESNGSQVSYTHTLVPGGGVQFTTNYTLQTGYLVSANRVQQGGSTRIALNCQ